MSMWSCECCGGCCKEIYDNVGGMRFGLTLLKEDVQYFPEDKVKPYLGKGNGSKPASVFAWQLDMGSCPNLTSDNLCGIRGHRPLFCRQFPLNSFGASRMVYEKCAVVFRMLKDKDKIEFPTEVNRCAYRAHLLFSKHIADWMFDLLSMRWLPSRQCDRAIARDIASDGGMKVRIEE